MLREEVKYLLKTTGVLNSLLHSIMHLSLKRESIVFSIEMNTMALQKFFLNDTFLIHQK